MVRFNVSSKYQFYVLITIHFLIVSFENVVFRQESIAFISFTAHIDRKSTVTFSLTLIDVHSEV